MEKRARRKSALSFRIEGEGRKVFADYGDEAPCTYLHYCAYLEREGQGQKESQDIARNLVHGSFPAGSFRPLDGVNE